MKRVRRWRYYCDHCGKCGGSGGHMKKHETSCTANPRRVCGYCGQTRPVAELIQVLGSRGTDWKAGMAALREATHDCPGCLLAVIRQEKFYQVVEPGPWEKNNRSGMEWETEAGVQQPFGFDYSAEKANWWRVHPREPRRPHALLAQWDDSTIVGQLLMAIHAQTNQEDGAFKPLSLDPRSHGNE